MGEADAAVRTPARARRPVVLPPTAEEWREAILSTVVRVERTEADRTAPTWA